MNWITIGGVHYNMDHAVTIEPTKDEDHTGFKITFANQWVSIGLPLVGPAKREEVCAYSKILFLVRNAGTYPEQKDVV